MQHLASFRRVWRADGYARYRISLLDSVPLVWRSVIVPESITLPRLHAVILWSMGWQGGHLHGFVMASGRYGEPDPEVDPGNEERSEERVKLTRVLAGTNTFEYVYDFGENFDPKQFDLHATNEWLAEIKL